MKKKKEIELDFTGGQGSLTLQEEKALSAYFSNRKLNSAKKKRLTKQPKAVTPQ